MSNYTALLLTDRSFEESPLAQRLSQECDITYASTPKDFMKSLKSTDSLFSAFLLDAKKRTDGIIDLIRELRELDRTSYTPIFLVVDDITDEILEEASDAGVTDILVRPYTPFAHRRVMTTLRLIELTRELERSNEELKEAKRETENFLKRMPGGLFRYRADEEDNHETIDYLSSGLISMMGCETEEEFRELCGNTFQGFVHPDDIDRVEHEIAEQIKHGEQDRVTYRVIRKDGEVRWLEDCGKLVTDSQGREWFYVVVLDITEKMLESQTYQKRAEHDSLTGLLNRRAAMARIEELRTRSDEPCSMILLDVDDFKNINDSHGHLYGDKVLMHLANFLKSVVRENDIVARLGGDEFVVFIMGLEDGDRLRHVMRRISETAFADFAAADDNGKIANPSVSIGATTSPDSALSTIELYDLADSALYNAKAAGKNGYYIEPNC